MKATTESSIWLTALPTGPGRYCAARSPMRVRIFCSASMISSVGSPETESSTGLASAVTIRGAGEVAEMEAMLSPATA
ncbi:Uncharacterised protein [Mycobacterium tuberculosis]|nr:Uncharacterised protein [Mycobacterium tuberculosis]